MHLRSEIGAEKKESFQHTENVRFVQMLQLHHEFNGMSKCLGYPMFRFAWRIQMAAAPGAINLLAPLLDDWRIS